MNLQIKCLTDDYLTGGKENDRREISKIIT